jgi:hypothetical protein
MESRVLTLDDVLRERQRWCVPVYQRHYEWETGENGQLTRLWEDIEEKAEGVLGGSNPYPHYIGAIIVAEPTNQPFGTVRERLLVDGQQRITTFQLVLAAVRETARALSIETLIPVVDAYLFNDISGGMSNPQVERYKLWPSSFDRQLYRDIADNSAEAIPGLHPSSFYKKGSIKTGAAPRLLNAYWYLLERIRRFAAAEADNGAAPDARLNAVLKGFLAGFRVVVIQLDEKDDAQEIFASLNGLGKPLRPIDLIRNDVFYRARQAGEDDQAIFDGHWMTFEDEFWEVLARQGRFHKQRIDFFLGHVLVAESAHEINLGKLAAEYQNYARSREFPSVADEIAHIVQYVPTYKTLIHAGAPTVASDIADFLRVWDLTVFCPLIFHVAVQPMEDNGKRALFDLLKSYILRRDLCDLGSKNYNNVVLRCLQRLRSDGCTAGVLANLFDEMKGEATRFPSDEEVVHHLGGRKLYNVLPTPRLRYVLQGIEERKRTRFDETVIATDNATVEHVMPQRWATNWPLPDGSTAPCESSLTALISHDASPEVREQIATRERLVDSLGNLTLVTSSLNPSMGHESFSEKKAKLSKSLLVLNREIAEHLSWDEAAITKRGIELARITTEVWPGLRTAQSTVVPNPALV